MVYVLVNTQEETSNNFLRELVTEGTDIEVVDLADPAQATEFTNSGKPVTTNLPALVCLLSEYKGLPESWALVESITSVTEAVNEVNSRWDAKVKAGDEADQVEPGIYHQDGA